MLHTLKPEVKIKWMRCSLVVSSSDNQQSRVQSQQPPVHIGFWKATDETRWNKVYKNGGKSGVNTGKIQFKDNGKEIEGKIVT